MIEIFGIGIDIVNIQKFKKKPFKKNQSFYKRIFSKSEIEYCLKYKNPYEKFAGKFAIKEAVIKSIHSKIGFSQIEISYSKSKPIVKLKIISKKYKFIISLSHESDFAVAVVISEKIK
tara:strand:+ start:711 stop:1064 length:354 start_codon:yes stop_codon:yes gene_type:complete